MNKQLKQVEDFQKAFGGPVGDKPSFPNEQRCELRQKLLQEEVLELYEAWSSGDIIEVSDAITDCLYILFGTAIEFGLQDKLEALFDEVHGSNMSKLNENGRPIYREDGKVLKGKNYYKPDLKKVLHG
jgi:predicted HAD superfamily Cof-like phosphohydrolase